MDGLEEFEELFGLDMTDNKLSESFYSGPINFDNLFEETEMEQFDSIVPDDITRFLDTEITEADDDNLIPEDISNYDPLDLGIDGMCQIKQELPVPESCQVKLEVPKFFISHPDINQVPAIDFQNVSSFDNNNHVPINENIINSDTKKKLHHNEDFLVKNLKIQEKFPIVNHKTEKKRTQIPDFKGAQSPIRKGHTKDVKSFHFCDLCPFKTKDKSTFRMHQSFVHKIEATKSAKKPPSQKPETIKKSYKPAPPKTQGHTFSSKNSKDVKYFHFCDVCPFKTKEKSIFRMHQTFVHKIEATKSEKKPHSPKSEIIGRPYKPAPPKTEHQTIPVKKQYHLTYEPNTRKSKVIPLGSLILPKLQTIQNGNQNNNTQPQPIGDNIFPDVNRLSFSAFPTTGTGYLQTHQNGNHNNNTQLQPFVDTNKLRCSAFPTGTGHLRSILKSSEGESKVKTTEFPFNSSVNLFLPLGDSNGTSGNLNQTAPNKSISILPKDPDYLLNRFQQTYPNLPEQMNQRHLLNALERKRRSDNKGSLEAVKNMVPKLRFVEKPTQITILKETLEYVKSLQKTEKDDSEELAVQRKKYKKLNEKYNSFFPPYYFQ